MVGSSDSRTCRRCSLSLHSGPSPDSWFRRASAAAGNFRPVARPADQGPGLSLAVTASSSASSDFPPEEPTADRVPVREISSEEGSRLLRIVPPGLRVGGEPAAGADRGCCPPRACRCRIAEVTCTSPGPGPRRDPQLRRRRVRRALPALPGRPPRGGRRLSATKDWACCWARRAGPFNGCRAPKTSTDPNDETKKNRVLELAAIADAPAAARSR